ncbi:hypothetical protein M8J75_012983 [Diaphorina citri]|nr:hypothetical protein M8J75_012983 [Diaphorina citri]KAI5752082.1 hypothetical protein M8J77_013664 [Diaphorina citri]
METRNNCYLNSGYNHINDTFESVDNLEDDEGYQFDNEMYVDDEEILSKVHNIDTRDNNVYSASPFRRYSPVGQSIRQYDSRSTLLSITPQKHNYQPVVQRHREFPKVTPKRNFKLDRCASYSVPNRRNNLDVLAPMIAQAALNQQNSAQNLRRTMSIAGISQYRGSYHGRNQSPSDLISPNLPTRTRSARVISSRRRLNMNITSPNTTSQALLRHHSLVVRNHNQSTLSPEKSLRPALDDLETTFSVKNTASSICGSQYSTSKSMAVISPTYRPTARVTSTPIKLTPIVDDEEASFFKKSFSPSKEHSWIRSPRQHLPMCSLFLASSLLLISGAASFLMAFYLLSLMGRTYYLNVGVFSGTVSMTLGMLGFRFRDWEWLPNRNYVSGFILISLFSLVHMIGLLVLIKNILTMAFETMDIIGGALCCISVIQTLLASFGLLTSCCCKYPPPDNRVAHGVEGFTV